MKSYPDASGRSIGFGHFIQPGEDYAGRPMGVEEAEALLEKDIAKHQDPWIGLLERDIGESGIAALTSFAYNAGAYGKGIKDVIGLINEGKTEEAAEVMQRYNKSEDEETGVLSVNPVLVERRQFEADRITGENSEETNLSELWKNRDRDTTMGAVSRTVRKAATQTEKYLGKAAKSISDTVSTTWSQGRAYVTGLASMLGREQSFDPTETRPEVNIFVLQGLRELNATLGLNAQNEQQERLWINRILQEGKGWQG